MKINNETKVGILAVIAVALLVLGFNFLKGKSLFNKTNKLYAIFGNLSGLDKSNQVKIHGLPVGTVYEFTEMDKEVSGIVVTINLTRDVNIPKNSVAHISSGIVGSSYIVIDIGDSKQYMENGDTLITRIDDGLLGDLTSQVSPTLSKARDAIDSLKMVLSGANRLFDPSMKGNIQAIMNNLLLSSVHLQRVLSEQTIVLGESLKNLNSITGNFAKNNDKITHTFENLETASGKFANLDIDKILNKLDSSASYLKNTMARINSNDGSLGLLLNDKTLYKNLNNFALGLETLIDDIRVHPKRYVNISVFGGKDRSGPISSPTAKDTIRVGLR